MKIIDTFPAFTKEATLERLRQYHENYPEIFNEYFSYHCKNTDERLHKAIEKYPNDWDSINKVHQSIEHLLEEIVQNYQTKYQLDFPITVNLIIGAYGTNAYTHREIIPDITFAMEKLSFEADPLRIIIAHEFGHVAHNILSDGHGMDWKTVHWNHPYIWLLQEGAATHFSKQIIPNLNESIYFSYNNAGDEWLQFAKDNKRGIISRFVKDINSGKSSMEVFKEWFSINGGSTFGYSRLAYFIADCFFQDRVNEIGELNTLLLWKNEDYFSVADAWLGSCVPAKN
ncbi:hypothetical protein [Ureibacillus sp. GCM10028918]|uniref:hypothetical protein n=1 Tax=Ureibacillus sp. GCM10028918 TaxID=3273429 RepID=UPI0036175487